MAPTKKRERDNGDNAGVAANNINGLNNGGRHADAAANEALAAPASAAATAANHSTTNHNETHTKLNGHQQEQELFLQAFESMFASFSAYSAAVLLINKLFQNPHKSIATYAIDTKQT